MKKRKFLIPMLAVASTLALGVLGSCAGIDKISQKIKEKKCDHEEYQIVEVTEEATCVLEGERLLECVECGKTKTEKFLLQHVDEDGDDTCDVCDAATIELVEAEVGEKVVGNTYRIYHSTEDMSKYGLYISASSEVEYFNCPDGISIWVQDASVSYNPPKSSTDKLPFEIKEVWTKNYTEGYIEFTVEAGEYTLDDIAFNINEDAEITKFIDKGGVYRVVPLE